MNVSQTAEYALRAVVCLARHDDAQTTQHIAECTGVPQSYLPKVLQPLARAGLVSAQRGVRGGYMLQRGSDTIAVLDVVNCVDPIRRIDACPNSLPGDQQTLCPLHRLLDQAIASTEEIFAGATIESLAFGQDGQPAKCGAMSTVTQNGSVCYSEEPAHNTAI